MGEPTATGSAAADMPLTIGSFKVIETLESSALGTLYKALNTQPYRVSALRVMPADTLRRCEVSQDLLLADVETVSKLCHPHVAAVHSWGDLGDAVVVEAEFVEGVNVKALIAAEGRLNPDQGVRIASAVAEALSAAHARGLFHRRVQPQSILLTQTGEVRLADLGLGRAFVALDSDRRAWRLEDAFYASPEQAAGAVATAADDVYSLGATLFHMLTGRPPFEADSAAELLQLHRTAPVPNPRRYRPELPTALCGVVTRMLAKAAEDRPRTGDSLLRQLARAAESVQRAEMGGALDVQAAMSAASRRRRTAGLALAAIAPLALVAGGIWFALAEERPDPDQDPFPWRRREAAAPADAAGRASKPHSPAGDEAQAQEMFGDARRLFEEHNWAKLYRCVVILTRDYHRTRLVNERRQQIEAMRNESRARLLMPQVRETFANPRTRDQAPVMIKRLLEDPLRGTDAVRENLDDLKQMLQESEKSAGGQAAP